MIISMADAIVIILTNLEKVKLRKAVVGYVVPVCIAILEKPSCLSSKVRAVRK